MPRKIDHILIPFIIAMCVVFGHYILSVGQTPTSTSLLPLVAHDISGWIGPDGGYLVVVAVDPSNPQVVYTGSWGSGVFKSRDGGQRWQPANDGLDNLYINSLAIDPILPSTLYAGTYKSQVYKSEDGGSTWAWSGTGMQDQAIVYTIAIDPITTNTIYAGTRGLSNNGNPPWKGVVYKSINAGQTWSPVFSDAGGKDVQDWVYSLAVHPMAHNIIYAALHEHGPYYSWNYGASWNAIHNGIMDDSGRAIVIDPGISAGATLYYGVWHDDSVYKSNDWGHEWFLSNDGIPFTKVYSMAIDPMVAETVYLATFNRGVVKTLDGGGSWQPAGLSDNRIYNLAIDPISPTKLYAGTSGDGVYRSLNGGETWQPSNAGIENAMPTTVIVSLSNPEMLYASVYGAGVYRTTDRGHNWVEMNAGLGDKFVHALVRNAAQPNLLYALTDTGGLYQTDMNSNSGWVSMGQGLPMTMIPQSAYPFDHPFATHDMQENDPPFLNSNESSLTASANLLVMTYAASDPQITYMGTGGAGVYKSVNAGASWFSAGLVSETVQSLAVDPTDPNLVYAATVIPGSLNISLDGGSSWQDVNLPVTFYSLATSPNTHGILYAGTSKGIYRYQAGTWTQLGLANQTVTAITIDPNQPGLIYAGTTTGAFYSIDSGLAWKLVNTRLWNISIQSINLDPAHINRVYISTKTHGVYLANISN